MADGARDMAAAAVSGGPTHPLQYRWTLWYDNSAAARKNRFASWDENLTKLMTFGTVEEFWALFNNILEPSHLAPSSNYHLFKEGIAPKWEDAANSEGGKWVLMNPPSYKERLDQYWIHTVRLRGRVGRRRSGRADVARVPLMPRGVALLSGCFGDTRVREPIAAVGRWYVLGGRLSYAYLPLPFVGVLFLVHGTLLRVPLCLCLLRTGFAGVSPIQVLTVIGEGFEAPLSDDIAGLVLSTRRQADRISMWTKTSADEPMQKRIGYVHLE